MPHPLLAACLLALAASLAAAADPPRKLRVALLSGSEEYKSDESLSALQRVLEADKAVECVRMFRKSDAELPNLGKLSACDLAVFYTRRLKLPDDQLAHVKEYLAAGKPVVGVRSASHGFQTWLAMDKEVFGGDYKNHYGAGPRCDVKLVPAASKHPVLRGVEPFASPGSLYKNKGVAADVTVLLTGTTPDATEPVAWVRERLVGKKKQRVFYTSLGHPDDFQQPAFRRLLLNAVGWAVGEEGRFTKWRD